MRYPRILTCSSARPMYSSSPSAFQRTKSPVRYIRAPGAPNGHATNRVALKSGRPRYPAAKPPPATYNSPTTPTGAGRNHPSSTKNPRWASGTPIGDTARSTSAPVISRNDACTVVSVIPYMLTIRGRPGWRCIHADSRAGSNASPPKTTVCNPSCSPTSGYNASAVCRASKADGVCESIPTRSPTSSACNSSGERTTESATITSRPP